MQLQNTTSEQEAPPSGHHPVAKASTHTSSHRRCRWHSPFAGAVSGFTDVSCPVSVRHSDLLLLKGCDAGLTFGVSASSRDGRRCSQQVPTARFVALEHRFALIGGCRRTHRSLTFLASHRAADSLPVPQLPRRHPAARRHVRRPPTVRVHVGRVPRCVSVLGTILV